MPLLSQGFQHIGRGRISAGLALSTARQTHFAEQHIAQLFRRADIERMPGEFMDFFLKFRSRLAMAVPCVRKTAASMRTPLSIAATTGTSGRSIRS